MSRKRHVKTLKSRFPEEAPFTQVDEYLLEALNQTITVRTKDGAVEMTTGELLIKRQIESALKGASHAAGQVTKAHADAQAKREHQLEHLRLIGEHWKRQQQTAFDEAIAKGKSTREILPHPDDIIIDHREGYRLLGPCCIEALEVADRFAAWRDVYIMQSHLEECFDFPAPSPHAHPAVREADATGSALIYAMLFDQALPKRMRITEDELLRRELSARRLTKRELLKAAHMAWKSIRLPKPRGWLTPPIEQGFEQQLRIFELIRREKDLRATLHADEDITVRQIVEAVRPIAKEVARGLCNVQWFEQN
jgi:hypothetical protein